MQPQNLEILCNTGNEGTSQIHSFGMPHASSSRLAKKACIIVTWIFHSRPKKTATVQYNKERRVSVVANDLDVDFMRDILLRQ
jgi:hypothetical protein